MMKLGEMVVMLLTMMVVLEFIGIPTGISATLNSYGVNINPKTSELISADMGNSSIWHYIFGNTGILILLLGGGAVIVGLFAKSYDTSLVVLPLIITTATLFISTFSGIIEFTKTLGQAWMTALVSTIFIALGAAFIWSCIDYFTNR